MQLSPGALLAVAIVLLFAAHAARAARWSVLFPRKRKGRRQKSLLLPLGCGYAVNALVPLRLGELVRGVAASRLNRVRLPEVMATILTERVADLAVLALIIGAFAPRSSDPAFANATAALFAAVSALVVLAAIVIRASVRSRRAVWLVAGLFNDRIRIALIDFIWSSAEMLVGGTLLRWKFTLATIGMWMLYAAAFAVYGLSAGRRVMDVAAAMVQRPLGALAYDAVGLAGDRLSLLLFAVAPVAIILVIGPVMRADAVARLTRPFRGMIHTGRSSHDARSERFNVPMGYANFLRSLFSGEDGAIGGFGLAAIDDCIVHKFYQGGSEALTALVETDERLVIRKFASGVAASKLKVQAASIRDASSGPLAFVDIVDERDVGGSYSYDMPFLPNAMDFYDAIHVLPSAHSRMLLREVITQADALHGATQAGSAPAPSVSRYLDEKGVANATAIAAFARTQLGSAGFSINGTDHDWHRWSQLTDRAWLEAQIRQRTTATIHGDLTIENVIVAPDRVQGLYIIDPNPENIFDSPLLDWAKLMQSLHLGYEAMNRGVAFSRNGSAMSLPDSRSEAYAGLHCLLEEDIVARFGSDGLREVYFHEIVHYLRLTRYKIRQSTDRGLAFFACTAQLLDRYHARFA